jgi:hypothetical protein
MILRFNIDLVSMLRNRLHVQNLVPWRRGFVSFFCGRSWFFAKHTFIIALLGLLFTGLLLHILNILGANGVAPGQLRGGEFCVPLFVIYRLIIDVHKRLQGVYSYDSNSSIEFFRLHFHRMGLKWLLCEVGVFIRDKNGCCFLIKFLAIKYFNYYKFYFAALSGFWRDHFRVRA